MRTTNLIVAVSLGLALAACGKKHDETTTVTTNDTSITADNNLAATDGNATATAAAMPAQKFTDTVVGSDMFEIQSGKLAETMGSTPAIKDFGKMLVADHSKSSDALKAAAKKTSPVVALPMVLPTDLEAKLDALKAAKGADFDKLFVEQQTDGHKAALDALKTYAAGGDQTSLKEWATSVIPTVEGHLTKLEAMPK
jgi:putative membrane protein